MSNNNNDLRLTLVHYLVKVEKYKVNAEISDDYNVYLYNKKAQFKVIALTIGEALEHDEKLNKLVNSLKGSKREKVDTLKIAIYDGSQQGVVCISSLDEARMNLKKYFPKITSLQIKQAEVEEENLSEEELLETLTDPSGSSNIKLKKLVGKMNSNSAVSIFISVAFCILPVICLLLSSFISDAWIGVNGTSATAMFFGGTNKALTIIGQQFWRIFTYIFNVQGNGVVASAFQLIFLGVFVLKVTKYTEGLLGTLKFAFVIFITYPLVGLFLSVMFPSPTFSGNLILPAMVVGSLGVTTWSKKSDTIVLFSKNRLIYPLIIMLIYVLFITVSEYDVVLIILGCGVSASITLLFTYDYKNIDGYIILPVLILGIAFVVPVVFIFIPSYGIAPDLNALLAMLSYANHKVFSADYLNKIIHDLNGWNYSLQSSGVDASSYVISAFI
ncbi:hypothetical protein [Spiroplasma tabanidicola]|uniref:Rhomboid protease GluP n=1 Tax=Spiroplasma tabanidicola TaxID=324079 RepID=A0A6I6CB19_9MOLU|nr:hypothetical protein [Spiroplasma tabanidicola]QGS52135.1 rhomboid protease GluP [Spiroplasma tabanidicola]